MDTTWYAVDDDGHVAELYTGESGALPFAAPGGSDAGRALSLAAKAQPQQVLFDLEGRSATQEKRHRRARQALFFLRDDEAVQPLLERMKARPVPGTAGKAYRIVDVGDDEYAALHANDNCLGCGVLDDYDLDSPKAGIFQYVHPTGNLVAEPYARVIVPFAPTPLAELPPHVRAAVVKYDGRFADSPRLQPAEHWRCVSWEPAWLATDQKTIRPLMFRFFGFFLLRQFARGSEYVFSFWPFGGRRRSWWRLRRKRARTASR